MSEPTDKLHKRVTESRLLLHIFLIVIFPFALVIYAISGFGRGISECIEDIIDRWERK